MNTGLLLIAALGYALGCIPTAWIVFRLSHGKDIREHGTGNVGAMNTYDVSGSKRLGILVFLLDALKGAAAVGLARLIHGDWFAATALATVFMLVGHNYNVLLKFKGGRGLAPATGAFVVLNPFAILLWDVMYLTGYYAIRKNVHVGAVAGTIGLAALMFSTPDRIVTYTTLVDLHTPMHMRLLIGACCLVILLRHAEPIRALLREIDAEEDDAA